MKCMRKMNTQIWKPGRARTLIAIAAVTLQIVLKTVLYRDAQVLANLDSVSVLM